MCSRIFDAVQVKDMGPHTFAHFHLLGTVPLSIESWKILVRIGAISVAYSFRNHGGMAEGPEVLFVFNSDNCFL